MLLSSITVPNLHGLLRGEEESRYRLMAKIQPVAASRVLTSVFLGQVIQIQKYFRIFPLDKERIWSDDAVRSGDASSPSLTPPGDRIKKSPPETGERVQLYYNLCDSEATILVISLKDLTSSQPAHNLVPSSKITFHPQHNRFSFVDHDAVSQVIQTLPCPVPCSALFRCPQEVKDYSKEEEGFMAHEQVSFRKAIEIIDSRA